MRSEHDPRSHDSLPDVVAPLTPRANGVPGLPLHHCLNQGTSLSDAMRRPWTLVTPYTTLYFIVAVLTAPRLRNSVQALLNVFSAWPEIPSVWLWPRR